MAQQPAILDFSNTLARMAPFPPTLATLPGEIQLSIIERIKRPSHLKSVCLTSTWLRKLATAQLYASIKFDLCEAALPDPKGLWVPGHYGHQLVREIKFHFLKSADAAKALDVATFAVGLLPKDVLKGLE